MMTYYLLINFSLAGYALDLSSSSSFLSCSAQHSRLRSRAMTCESMRAATAIVVMMRLYIALIAWPLLSCATLRRWESILTFFAHLAIHIHVAEVVRIWRALRFQMANISWSTWCKELRWLCLRRALPHLYIILVDIHVVWHVDVRELSRRAQGQVALHRWTASLTVKHLRHDLLSRLIVFDISCVAANCQELICDSFTEEVLWVSFADVDLISSSLIWEVDRDRLVVFVLLWLTFQLVVNFGRRVSPRYVIDFHPFKLLIALCYNTTLNQIKKSSDVTYLLIQNLRAYLLAFTKI